MNGEQGKPGKPGEPSIGQEGGRGGEGGEGGRGGYGSPIGAGGMGGMGGPGGVGAAGPQGPRGEAGKYEAIHKWRWTALTIWIIAFTTAVLVLFHNNGHRIEDNKRVVAAIQRSRREACLRTYDAMSTILIFELKEREHRDISDPERLALMKLTTPQQCRNIK